jgi:hypothetical protein
VNTISDAVGTTDGTAHRAIGGHGESNVTCRARRMSWIEAEAKASSSMYKEWSN